MLFSRNKQDIPKAPEEAYGQRTHARTLQTAVNTYRHPDGRTITIVGIEHIAEADYYLRMRKLVDELEAEGAQIRLEHTNPRHAADAARTEAERSAVEGFRADARQRFSAYHAVGLPWIDQAESAMGEPGPNWVHSDVDVIDFIRLVGPHVMASRPQSAGSHRLAQQVERIKAAGRPLARRAALLLIRSNLVDGMIKRGIYVRRHEIPEGWWLHRIVNTWRECEEMRKVLARDGDTVLIWGAVHMLGFNEILTRNDFELVDTEWLTAIDARNKGTLPQ